MKKAKTFSALDFLFDTVMWTNEEVGSYWRLRLHEMVIGGFDDINSSKTQIILAGLCGHRGKVGLKKWAKIWETIGTKFLEGRDE